MGGCSCHLLVDLVRYVLLILILSKMEPKFLDVFKAPFLTDLKMSNSLMKYFLQNLIFFNNVLKFLKALSYVWERGFEFSYESIFTHCLFFLLFLFFMMFFFYCVIDEFLIYVFF